MRYVWPLHNVLIHAMYVNVARIVISDDEEDKNGKAAADTVTFPARPDRVMADAAALAPVRPDHVMAEAVVFTENLCMPRSFAPQPNTSRHVPFRWQ